MSSFFSRFSTQSTSASSSVHSNGDGKETPPPTHEIFTSPPDGIVAKKKWEYTEEQLQKIEKLREYSSTLLLPESDPYHQWEKRFLSDPGCHPRFMRAAKWRLPEGKTRIKGTIDWRREFKPELIPPEDIAMESETGKIILSGFDLDARPILYMRPGRENTETGPRQIRHLIYMLERAIDFMPPGQEQVAIIVDYKSATSQSNPSIGTARKVLNVLQNHYVERLGRGLVVNMPWWINAFFTGISPFLDPITRDKIRFNPKLVELCPEEQLDQEFGGVYNLDFDFKTYWETIREFCHITEDGTRRDNDGKAWVPPLGNGIKAAAEGVVPTEGATQTGETEKSSGGEGNSKAEPETGAEQAVVVGAGVAGAAGAARTVAAGSTSEDDKAAAQKLASETRAENPEMTNGAASPPETAGTTGIKDDETLAGGMNNVHLTDGARSTGTGTPERPSHTTKPGEPVGDGAVFDHEPSKKEVKEALSQVGA